MAAAIQNPDTAMRAVLTYHSLDDSGSPISVDPDVFARHVRWLISGRVRVTTLEEIAGCPADEDAVALTFDDGFENFATIAVPLLREHGLPATLFVVTDCVGGTNRWNGRPAPGIPTLPLLDWPSLERLSAGGITLGAHTRTHRDLTGLRPEELEDEIAGSADRLSRNTGSAPRTFAYPYGQTSHAAVQKVAASFDCGCTTDHRTFGLEERPALLPRLDMYYYQAAGRLEAWGTPSFRRHLAFVRSRRRLRSALRLPRGNRA